MEKRRRRKRRRSWNDGTEASAQEVDEAFRGGGADTDEEYDGENGDNGKKKTQPPE